MKKITILFSLLIACLLTSAQVKLETLVKPGTKLIYAVEAQGKKYDFIVTVKKLSPLVFDWQMTDPVNTSGTITHTAKAMISANTMYNFFSPGAKKLDDKTISVWLSKNTFAGIMKAGKGIMMKMNVGAEPKKMGTYTGALPLEILVDGQTKTVDEELVNELSDKGVPADNDDDFFTVYGSAKLPIILRMRNGFYIGLKEIKTK